MIVLAAILALALAAAVPAIAQVSLEGVNEAESESLEAAFDVSNTGDYASQCVPALQFGNTGNFNNAPSFLQYDSESDDLEPGGLEFSLSPALATECASEVQRSSAASS